MALGLGTQAINQTFSNCDFSFFISHCHPDQPRTTSNIQRMTDEKWKMENGAFLVCGLIAYYFNKDFHRPPANHSLFAGFPSRQRKMMKRGFAGTHRLARFRPNFRFNATAAHRSHGGAVLKKQHLRPALLRSGAASMRDSR
jgi:hypothetical protein